MREKIEAATISRRSAFWILGLGATFGLAMPVAVLTARDAEAQTSGTGQAPGTAQTGTPGTKRRQDRRTDRHDRRDDRRTGRQDRREDRRGTVGQGTK
jgi:hypothetical protein